MEENPEEMEWYRADYWANEYRTRERLRMDRAPRAWSAHDILGTIGTRRTTYHPSEDDLRTIGGDDRYKSHTGGTMEIPELPRGPGGYVKNCSCGSPPSHVVLRKGVRGGLIAIPICRDLVGDRVDDGYCVVGVVEYDRLLDLSKSKSPVPTREELDD